MKVEIEGGRVASDRSKHGLDPDFDHRGGCFGRILAEQTIQADPARELSQGETSNLSHRGFFRYAIDGRSRHDGGGDIRGEFWEPARHPWHPPRPQYGFRSRSPVSIPRGHR